VLSLVIPGRAGIRSPSAAWSPAHSVRGDSLTGRSSVADLKGHGDRGLQLPCWQRRDRTAAGARGKAGSVCGTAGSIRDGTSIPVPTPSSYRVFLPLSEANLISWLEDLSPHQRGRLSGALYDHGVALADEMVEMDGPDPTGSVLCLTKRLTAYVLRGGAGPAPKRAPCYTERP